MWGNNFAKLNHFVKMPYSWNQFLSEVGYAFIEDKSKSAFGVRGDLQLGRATLGGTVYSIGKAAFKSFSNMKEKKKTVIWDEMESFGVSEFGVKEFLGENKLPDNNSDLHVLKSQLYLPVLNKNHIKADESQIYCALLHIRSQKTTLQIALETAQNRTF